MDVLDLNGNKIHNGMYVKYIGTHTVGKVDKIMIKNEVPWIRIDSSGLYYRGEYIEIVADKNYFIKQNKPRKVKSEKFDIKIPVEISDTTDGPGVGGG